MAQQGPAPALGALTMLEYARFSNNPQVRAIAMSLYEQDSITSLIPWRIDKTMTGVGAYFDGSNMPRVDRRKINGLPETTKAIPKRWTESAYILSNIIVVDRYLEEDRNAIVKPSTQQVRIYLESVKYTLNDIFFNSDGVTGIYADSPVGLKPRIASSDTGDTYHVQKGLHINGAVDISPATLAGTGGKAAALNFISRLDNLLSQLNAKDGKNVVLFMNEKTQRQAIQALFTLGGGAGLSTTEDQFGKMLTKFRCARIVDPGRKEDQNTYVINPYETAAGADSDATTGASGVYGDDAAAGKNYSRIYAVKFGEGYFTGWQWEPLAPKVRGLADPGTYYEILFDWAWGWGTESTRSIADMYGIKVGA